MFYLSEEEFSKEIAATKSILFKTNFKRLNETFLRENEAERVLLNAMNVKILKIEHFLIIKKVK